MTKKTNKTNSIPSKRKPKKLRLTREIVESAIDRYIRDCSNDLGEIVKEPLMIELALILGVDPSTLWAYSKRPDYAQAIKRVKILGEMFLNRTMEGDKANQNAMFKLKTRHGYIEQQKVDITTAGQPLGVIQLPTR